MVNLKSIVLACAVLMWLGLHVSAAHAAQVQEYGAVMIRNPTSSTIYYEIKWGDGEWKSYGVEPYKSMHHWIGLDEYDRHPSLHIRFDSVGGDGQYTVQAYHLHTYKTYHPRSGGKPYTFKYSGRYYLDLYAGY